MNAHDSKNSISSNALSPANNSDDFSFFTTERKCSEPEEKKKNHEEYLSRLPTIIKQQPSIPSQQLEQWLQMQREPQKTVSVDSTRKGVIDNASIGGTKMSQLHVRAPVTVSYSTVKSAGGTRQDLKSTRRGTVEKSVDLEPKRKKRKGNNKGWSAEEDATVLNYVQNAKTISKSVHWSNLANMLPGRTENSCRVRWGRLRKTVEFSTPNAKDDNDPWSPEEENTLLLLKKANPNATWDTICKRIPWRSVKACKNKWAFIKPGDQIMAGSVWSSKDCEALYEIKTKNPDLSWEVIAQRFPGRTVTACMKSWDSMKNSLGRK